MQRFQIINNSSDIIGGHADRKKANYMEEKKKNWQKDKKKREREREGRYLMEKVRYIYIHRSHEGELWLVYIYI